MTPEGMNVGWGHERLEGSGPVQAGVEILAMMGAGQVRRGARAWEVEVRPPFEFKIGVAGVRGDYPRVPVRIK